MIKNKAGKENIKNSMALLGDNIIKTNTKHKALKLSELTPT